MRARAAIALLADSSLTNETVVPSVRPVSVIVSSVAVEDETLSLSRRSPGWRDNLGSSANSVTRIRQYWGMSSPANPTDTPEKSLAEFFAEIESGDGPSLTADDHRGLVAAVRSDRERPDA